MAIVSFISTLYLASVNLIKFYNFDEAQDAMGVNIWIYGTLLFVLLMYFLIYLFYKAVHAAAQKENEEMKY
jgi:uncharacterized BrkB/YihY/UPF0761 family membrane protein